VVTGDAVSRGDAFSTDGEGEGVSGCSIEEIEIQPARPNASKIVKTGFGVATLDFR
jgi:hypothetical protein